MTPTVDIQNLSFAYNGKEILHNIQFAVMPGEYISIIGPNGAGKSTLLKCLNRIVTIEQGTIRIMGKDLPQYDQKELGKVIGYLPQIREYAFSYSVYEFVMMGRYPHIQPLDQESKKDIAIVKEMIQLTGLSHLEHRDISTLSGGERQKVYLAASLAQQPRILLLDEPTTHLDPRHQIEIQETVSWISKQLNITVLHVTHDLTHIFTWSQRVAAFKDGRLRFIGNPCDVITDEKLTEIFDTKFLFLEDPKTKKIIVVPDDRKHAVH